MSISPYKVTLGTSIGVTTMLGLFSLMPSVLATTSSSSRNAVVTVGASCSMDSTVSSAHTATIAPGGYNKEIGLTNVAITCNDNGGYAIYAIGFGDDTLGNNVLHSTTTGTTDINTGNDFASATGSYSSNTSQWAMQVNNVSGSSIPTIVNNFDSLSLVPTTYTKVAEYNAATTASSTSAITTKYGAYIAIGHPAGTYTGKVKYTLVHPSTEPAPKVPPTPPTSCNTPVPDVTYMQEITSSNKATILAQLTEGNAYYLRDSRDEEPYCVSKLKDGNMWMLDNLRLDLTDSTTMAALTASNTNATEISLTSLRSGNRSAGNQYASASFATWDSNSTTNVYDRAKANAADKDTVNDDSSKNYGNGSHKYGVYYNYCAASAGSYCYGYYAAPDGRNATQDICPAGWRMPTGDSSGEYQALYDEYSSASEGQAVAFKNALSTPLSGAFNEGSAYDQGAYGYFFSSTRGNRSYMYLSYVDAFKVFPPQGMGYRHYGYSVRCLLQ
ncbi:hypothetical protein IJ101_01335 [Candidatus Saccharibacteria bacterium]|nr:hypothetical protein [Candidatus Saccharibacteria bacterium]